MKKTTYWEEFAPVIGDEELYAEADRLAAKNDLTLTEARDLRALVAEANSRNFATKKMMEYSQKLEGEIARQDAAGVDPRAMIE